MPIQLGSAASGCALPVPQSRRLSSVQRENPAAIRTEHCLRQNALTRGTQYRDSFAVSIDVNGHHARFLVLNLWKPDSIFSIPQHHAAVVANRHDTSAIRAEG